MLKLNPILLGGKLVVEVSPTYNGFGWLFLKQKLNPILLGGEFVVEVFYAVDLVGGIDCEWNPVQRFSADYTDEAGGMIGLPSGAQDLGGGTRMI